ncbi:MULTISPECIES: ABC transporter ATP-binding protein [Inquilinus]|uniref:ABC-type Fe3+/spermidine/putrescine transport system ATPase subunit n=1 Tax=Inquilinus ginsengisoli TaxID=363840 RepID=A0ABU1JWG9_9PROT|nr:ABC transporter ATP-binding protein [Inquilinus ginsengisoli]MDR6292966.1 ABC-type Fe3+/spermidine/putrescine transport system ATPase subunit [Inquilinus ginsengisoli]
MTLLLELSGIAKSYGGAAALADLSLAVGAGEYISILGPSGSGKSTMLRVIAGFETPDAGDVRLDGRSILAMPAHERGIGFVFQGFALFPHMSVADNVGFGLRNRSRSPVTDEAEIRRRVAEALELLGLTGLGARAVSQVSGGQKQRVALARTLVADPKIVLLDEPLGALDANLRERMMIELKRIQSQLGGTFLHVTGNEQEALAMGGRVAVLDQGRIAQISPPQTLYNQPGSVRVARFLNCYNIFQGIVGDGAFRFTDAALPLPGAAATGAAAYCIRADKVTVAEGEAPAGPGETGIAGRFIAGEYSGARVTYLFDVAGSRPVEVEYHLSHRRPRSFEAGRRYALRWPAADALVFPG